MQFALQLSLSKEGNIVDKQHTTNDDQVPSIVLVERTPSVVEPANTAETLLSGEIQEDRQSY